MPSDRPFVAVRLSLELLLRPLCQLSRADATQSGNPPLLQGLSGRRITPTGNLTSAKFLFEFRPAALSGGVVFGRLRDWSLFNRVEEKKKSRRGGTPAAHVSVTAIRPRRNTVHLMILTAFLMSIGGNGLAFRGRRGKLLILRLTPRRLRRLRLETARSWRISSSTAS